MTTERCNKLLIPVGITLLTLTLAGSPARSGQDTGSITPLVSIFAAGALLNYDRAAQHYQLYLGKDAMSEDTRQDEPHAGSSSGDYQEIHYSRL
jgi:hypothetical protein